MKFPKSISRSCRSGELYSLHKVWELDHNWFYPKYTKSQHSLLASRVCSSNTSHYALHDFGHWFCATEAWPPTTQIYTAAAILYCCPWLCHCHCHCNHCTATPSQNAASVMLIALPLLICCIATSIVERNNWISCPIFDRQVRWAASSSLKLHRLQICVGI